MEQEVKKHEGFGVASLAGIIMSSIALAFSVIVLVVVYVILLGAAAAL